MTVFCYYGGIFYVALQEFIICPAEGSTSPEEKCDEFLENPTCPKVCRGVHSYFKIHNSISLTWQQIHRFQTGPTRMPSFPQHH